MGHYYEQQVEHAARLRREQQDRERLWEANRTANPLSIEDKILLTVTEIQEEMADIREGIKHIKDAIQTLFRCERVTNEDK